MAGSTARGERNKIIIVIALSVLFIVVGYFRFFHGRVGLTKVSAPDTASPLTISIPVPDTKNVLMAPQPAGQLPEPPRARPGNLFAPPRGPASVNGPRLPTALEPPKPLPSLKLTGTILAGRGSIAIINGRFLKGGDRIEGFKIVSISRSQVSLADEERSILLDVRENVGKGDQGGFKN